MIFRLSNLCILWIYVVRFSQSTIAPKSSFQTSNYMIKNVFRDLSVATLTTIFYPGRTNAESIPVDADKYIKPLFSIPPGIFTYPKSFLGEWKVQYSYQGSSFYDKIPFENLARDINVPGFRKYSVVMVPDIGKDFTTTWSFVQANNGDITEDRTFNLKSTMESTFLESSCKVEEVEYDPPNRCSIRYK